MEPFQRLQSKRLGIKLIGDILTCSHGCVGLQGRQQPIVLLRQSLTPQKSTRSRLVRFVKSASPNILYRQHQSNIHRYAPQERALEKKSQISSD